MPTKNEWYNALMKAIAECLEERETPESSRAAEWVAENENADFMWEIVGGFLDELEQRLR